MKNIHILPTDKPSRLIKSKINDTIVLEPINVTNDTRFWEYLNIYITSDEEIKEGDWCYYENGDLKGIHKVVNGQRPKTMILKKIILTTDQDLIADGIQAIDDEFLEWFVKNPSCEMVDLYRVLNTDFSYKFRIIIPKEEPKQETLSWDELVQEAENKEELIKILKLPHIAPLVREAMRNNCKK
jgi:hypothetical protein